MQKLNTQLPKSIPDESNFGTMLSRIYGAVFLLLVGIVLIFIIYSWESNKNSELMENQTSGVVCIQVLTRAQNPATGEIKEFPNPCVVPNNWIKLKNQ
jgi:hypothetical protein